MPRFRSTTLLMTWGPANEPSRTVATRRASTEEASLGHQPSDTRQSEFVGDDIGFDAGSLPAITSSRGVPSDNSNDDFTVDVPMTEFPDTQSITTSSDNVFTNPDETDNDEPFDADAHIAPRQMLLADLLLSSSDESSSDSSSNSDEEASQTNEQSSQNPSHPSMLSQRASSHIQSSDPSSPSSSSSDESAFHDEPQAALDPFLLAAGLWCESAGISRQDYVRLREVFLLMQDLLAPNNEPIKFPMKLDTLKKQVRGHLPMLRVMRKAIPVSYLKQSTLSSGEKRKVQIERLSWIYWFDPIQLVRSILSATVLGQKMHFGMAIASEEPTELYESHCWASSNLSTSGQFAHSAEGNIVLVGDTVRFDAWEGFSKGLVHAVHREPLDGQPNTGTVVVSIMAIVAVTDNISDELAEGIGLFRQHELVLCYDVILQLNEDQINHHISVKLDREWLDGEEEVGGTLENPFYIKRGIRNNVSVPLRKLPPTRGELEITYFGREQLHSFAVPHDNRYDVRSFPIILFIDDFGVHRNMYRAIKAFYWIPAALPYNERRKIANAFTFTLCPYGSDPATVVECFRKALGQLSDGVFMTINDRQTLVRSYVLMMTGDMPQQADNSSFLRHSALRGCRACMCDKTERHDMDYDVEDKDNLRTHWDTILLRQHGSFLSGNEQARFFRDQGMRQTESSYIQLAPYLDIIQTRPWDAPHSEWRGLGRILQGLLVETILTKNGAQAFLSQLQAFPFPHGWARIQSPLLHIWSWSMSEAGRATLISPLVLRCKSRRAWFRGRYVQEFERLPEGVVGGDNPDPIQNIIRAYAIVAMVNSDIGSQQYIPAETVRERIRVSRKAYQCLLQAAHNAQGPAQASIDEDTSDSDAAEHNHSTLEHILDDDSEASLDDQHDAVPANTSSQFTKLQNLPNVHAGLHLYQNVIDFGTVMNCNVLVGEMKHKYFHRLADYASPKNLLAWLFACDRARQSIRLGLSGAWDTDRPDLQEAIQMLHTMCPRLIRSFLPESDRDEHELLLDAQAETQVREDDEHRLVSVSNKGFAMTQGRNDFNLSTNINIRDTGPNAAFLTALRAAFSRSYGVLGIVDFHDRRIRWKQRMAFTDGDGKRHVYSINDFTKLPAHPNSYGRIRQFFIVFFNQQAHLFFVADVVDHVDDPTGQQGGHDAGGIFHSFITDHILDMAVLRVERQVLCGLPELMTDFRRPYLIPAPTTGRWTTLESYDEDKEHFLECRWNIDQL